VTQQIGARAFAWQYDTAGRLAMKSLQNATAELEGYGYDLQDQLRQVRVTGGATEYLEYDPTGQALFRKVGSKGTWYVGSNATVTADVAAGCTTALNCLPVAGTERVGVHVLLGGGRVATVRAPRPAEAAGALDEVLYYHRDQQGSVVGTSLRSGGQDGLAGARYRYTPHGQLDRVEGVTAASDSELGYTGGLRLGYVPGAVATLAAPQARGLLLLGARVYHAELKRWLQPDTVDGRRYTYSGGDPVNFVDPGGRAARQVAPGIYIDDLFFTDRGFAQMYYSLRYGDSGSAGEWNLMMGSARVDGQVAIAVEHMERVSAFAALPSRDQLAVLDILKAGGRYATEWAAEYLRASYEDIDWRSAFAEVGCGYTTSSGRMTCQDDKSGEVVLEAQGWSGRGAGKDNPAWEGISNWGPLPRGFYFISGGFNYPGKGDPTFILSPLLGGQEMWGRSGFLIHGGFGPNDSWGCIILTQESRRALRQVGASYLWVRP
jgi:hypothetical protein